LWLWSLMPPFDSDEAAALPAFLLRLLVLLLLEVVPSSLDDVEEEGRPRRRDDDDDDRTDRSTAMVLGWFCFLDFRRKMRSLGFLGGE